MPSSDSRGRRSSSRTSRHGYSRRRFLSGIGAAGVGVGVAGCTGLPGGDGNGTTNGGNGTNGGNTTNGDVQYDGEEVTVEYSTAPLFGNVADQLKQSMYDAGLPETIDVQFNTTVWGADDLQDRYNQILSAGQSTPDFMLTNMAYTPYFAPRGWLVNLYEVLPQSKIDELDSEYHQTMVRAMEWEDGLYGIPQFLDIPTILYRKDLVTDAGYDPAGENWATEPMTWQRFSEIVSDVKEQAGVDHGYTTTLNQRTIGQQTGYEHIVTQGGNYFGDMENQLGPVGERPITIDDEPVIRTLRMLRTFMHGENDEYALDDVTGNILPAEALGWDTTPSQESFSAGQAVALRNWSYAIADLGSSEAFGEDLGVMPYPYGVTKEEAEYEGTGGTNAQLGGWHLSINPNTERMGATVEVIKAMTSDSFYLDIFELTGSSPPKPDLFTSDQAQNVEVMGRYLEQLRLQSDNQWVPPYTRAWQNQHTAISEEFHACLNQELSPEEAAANAQEEVQAIEEQIAGE